MSASTILKELKEAKRGLEDQMIKGRGVSDFSQYRFIVGHIRGFHDAIEIIEEYIKRSDLYDL